MLQGDTRIYSYPCAGHPLRILAGMQEARLSDAFADVVKNHREAKGISKAVLAERAGLHQTYIGLLEKRKSHASLDTANSLADGLGIPLEKLISEAKAIHQAAKRKK